MPIPFKQLAVVACVALLGLTCQAQDAPPDSPPAESPAAAMPASPVAAPAPASSATGNLVEAITVEDRPFLHGTGLFALGGAVGGLIASQAWKDEPDRIAAYVRQENIDIGAIVRSEFERQASRPDLAAAVKAAGRARFRITVKYGISSSPFSEYKPYLNIHAQLVDAQGNVKWKDGDYMGGRGMAKAIPYPDFFKSAQVFRSEFEVAAREVTTLVLKSLGAARARSPG